MGKYPHQYPQKVIELAREFLNSPLGYSWSQLELRILECFFSNANNRVFLVRNLPPNVQATLFSMFSRLKNKRGIRGVFVDQFLPQLLAAELNEVREKFDGDELAFLRSNNIKSIDEFYSYSSQASQIVEMFINGIKQDEKVIAMLNQSEKARKFLRIWLDKYGHSSIARMATIWFGFEQISILAVKSLAWARPGVAQIGLSTRYVDFGSSTVYPIAEELEIFGADSKKIREVIDLSFSRYKELLGLFPEFLRKYWSNNEYFLQNPKELETGIVGETFDVLGNLLPASTLTSVGFSVSGEALPSVLKHLLLDNTPENIALAELIINEASKNAADQFIRHYQPTQWDKMTRNYLEISYFEWLLKSKAYQAPFAILKSDPKDPYTFSEQLLGILAENISEFPRGEYDKLPREFEIISLPFVGVMSFRSWRDLQRQSLSTHLRTYLTTRLGFYHYDKPAPSELDLFFNQVYSANRKLEAELEALRVPVQLRQYVLALGNNVGFLMSSNLRQWEFCNWQRTKWSANHEVRQVFLCIERALRERYPWWKLISRSDLNNAYIFARGKKGVPLFV